MSDALQDEPRIPDYITKLIYKLATHSATLTATGMLVSATTSSTPMKGVVYAFIAILGVFFRISVLMMTGYAGPDKSIPTNCEGELPGALQFYDSGNRNAIFMLCFTLFYVSLPMFLANEANWYIIALITIQIALVCFVSYGRACISNMVVFACEIIGGAIYGCITSVILYYSFRNMLMITGLPSNAIQCSSASNQTFKCSVYKNGVLVGQQNQSA